MGEREYYNKKDFYNDKIVDVKFREKLELSYQKCLDELCSIPNWERTIRTKKYEIDENTGVLRIYYDFDLQFPDEIDIADSKHTYVFNRSHFYRKSLRLKHELENFWNAKGYYVKLFESEGHWYLRLGWGN